MPGLGIDKLGITPLGGFMSTPSAAFIALLANKTNNQLSFRIKWKLDAGDQDITKYFLSGADFAQEKERPPTRLSAGDATLTFDNSSGVFTEQSSTSFLYNVNYHNRKITFELGLLMADGSTQYYMVATMLVSDVTYASDSNQVTIHCYDAITRLINMIVNQTPSSLVAAFNGANAGNGRITAIATLPFTTKTENWTLTCTTPGGDGTAVFSVVGSVSGNIGNATSGTQFVGSTTGGVKFTIQGGSVNWANGDIITFSTNQMMEWTAYNPVKIMWSILTGYNWDTNTQDPWYARSAQLDNTRSDANVDLNYNAFASAVTTAALYFTLTGFVNWDTGLSDAIEELNMHFLGAFPIDPLGRLSINIYNPVLNASPRLLADTLKVQQFSYIRDMRDVVNQVTITYRKTTSWQWSDADQIQTLDGKYVNNNTTSQAALKQTYSLTLNTRYYNATGDHVTYLGTRIMDKYGRAPYKFTVVTGIDGVDQPLGNIIAVTDAKLALTMYQAEIIRRELNCDSLPVTMTLTADDTGTYGVHWAFCGSSANEGDGLSPQASTWDTAGLTDKYFAYASDGLGAAGGPLYYAF